MATKLKSIQEILNKVIKPTAYVMTNNMAANTAMELAKNVRDSIYRTPEPQNYKRTRQVLNSITYSKPSPIYSGRIYQAKVYFDYKKIRPMRARKRNYWNAHMDVHGSPFNDARLISVLNSGTMAPYENIYGDISKSHSKYQRPPAYFMEDTLKWLEGQVGPNATVSFVTMRKSLPEDMPDGLKEMTPTMWPVGIRIRRKR